MSKPIGKFTIYYKPPLTASRQGRLYRNYVQGSWLVAFGHYHNKSQWSRLSRMSNRGIVNLLVQERRFMGHRYKRSLEDSSYGAITGIAVKHFMSQEDSSETAYKEPSNYASQLSKIYRVIEASIKDGTAYDDNGYSIYIDTLEACRRYNGITLASNLIEQEPLETIDGEYTRFYNLGRENSHYRGDSVEGEPISLAITEDIYYCEACSFCEYEDTHDLTFVDCEDGYICSDCISEYVSCDSCDYYLHHGDSYNRGDNYYCESCYDETRTAIQSYSYTPDLHFYDYRASKIVSLSYNERKKSKVPFYGVELEVEVEGGSKTEYAEHITTYGGYQEKYFYCKEDGSLSDGFEICFMPMTFNAMKNLNLYEAIFKYRGSNKLQSYNTSSCGIHIHINREAFTDHHLFKFISFIHEFKSFVYLISQRKKVSELNNYAKFNNSFKDRAKKSMVASIKDKKSRMSSDSTIDKHSTTRYGDKYVPVNLQHTNTIEVRIFKGNLLEDSFRKNVEFVDSLYYFTKNNPIYSLKIGNYISHCRNEKKIYPNLIGYLDKNESRVKEILNFPLAVPSGLDY